MADATPLPGTAASGASRRPSATLAVADGLALVVAVALYSFGRTHTPRYAIGLMGHHGVAVITRAANWGGENLIGKRAWIFGPRVQLELAVHATRMKPALGPQSHASREGPHA